MSSGTRPAQSLLSTPRNLIERETRYGSSRNRLSSEYQSTGFGARAHLVRALALLCACSLSIGSHYASYILGPLKTRLSREMGTSNTEFSLLIAAFSLNSTWTPLVGGVLAGYLGTTVTSILATGLIFFGQTILLLGDAVESVRLMTFGMFIFGLGVSPLAVIQESIIVRFFKNHGLGLSMALGLVVGKASSFIAARTSYPLSETFGPRAPFIAATSLAALSFFMNLVYLSASRWLVTSSGTELEASELRREARALTGEDMSEAEALKQVAKKKSVHLRDITKLGDVFWAYIGINILCGAIWSPFTHLAANIFEKRYNLTEQESTSDASFLLAGSVFLYPIVGSLIDRLRHRPIILQLFVLSSVLTSLCYFWLVLPPGLTKTPIPAVALYGIGQGFAPLLLVVIVPKLVSSKYVPTTLGAHKSLEQTGTTIFQTFAGLFLDKGKPKNNDGSSSDSESESESRVIGQLLKLFLFLSICHFFSIIGLWALDRKRKMQAARAEVDRRVRTRARVRSRSREYGDEGENGVNGGGTGTDDNDDDDEDEEEFGERERDSQEGLGGSRRRRGSRDGGRPLLAKSESALESLSLQRREGSSSSDRAASSPGSEHSHSTGAVGIGLSREGGEGEGGEEEHQPLLNDRPPAGRRNQVESTAVGEAQTKSEHVRGEVFGILSICLIAFAWLFFIGTAFLRLRAKKDRQ